jgi:hypothetical protein
MVSAQTTSAVTRQTCRRERSLRGSTSVLERADPADEPFVCRDNRITWHPFHDEVFTITLVRQPIICRTRLTFPDRFFLPEIAALSELKDWFEIATPGCLSATVLPICPAPESLRVAAIQHSASLEISP